MSGLSWQEKEVRKEAKRFCGVIQNLTEPGREQSLALTKVQEAVLWTLEALRVKQEGQL